MMPRRLPLACRLGGLVLPLALAAGALPAQAGAADPQASLKLAQAETTAPAADFSQQKLESYAAAVIKVQEIDQTWRPKIDQAPNKEEAEAMATEATNEMVSEIEAQGLSVQEYNAITQAAEQDRQLYERIMTLLAQAQ